MSTIAEAKKHLEGYPDDMPCALSLWLPEDITYRAKDLDLPEPSDEVCGDVLSTMHYNHDANLGINWDTIDYHLSRYNEEA